MSGRAGGAARALRATLAASGLLLVRRARVDLALLIVLALVLVPATAAAALAPLVTTAVLDAGARDAVERAGSDADLLVEADVGRPTAGGPAVITPKVALGLARSVPAGLPEPLARLAAGATGVVVSPPLSATAPGGPDLVLRVGAVDPGVRVRAVAGRLPAEGRGAIEVALGRDAARTAGVGLGDVLRSGTASGGTVAFRVVGLVVPRDAGARRLAEDLPGLWRASSVQRSGEADGFEVAALASPEGALTAAAEGDGDVWTGRVRVPFAGDRFTAAQVPGVADAVESLAFSSSALGDVPVELRVESGFAAALAPFAAARDTAAAQLALALAGAVAVAVAVAVLLVRLLVRRRRAAVLLQRSRGASAAALALGALVEAAVLAAVATAAGLGIAALLVGAAGRPDPRPAVLVAAVVVAAAALGTAWSAAGALRRTGGGRPRRRGVRPVAEGTVLLLATGAVLAVRARGLQPAEGGRLDPLLVAAPVLVAAAAALVAIRVHPLVVRLLARLAARSRGALGVVTTAHAERSLSAAPLAVLALAVGVAVGGVLLTDGVRRTQAEASWQVVGGDAHLTGALPDDAEARLDRRPGVAAAAVHVRRLVEVTGPAETALVTLLAVDGRYPALLAGLPGGLDPAERRALTRIEPGAAPGAAVPVLVSADAADRFRGTTVEAALAGGVARLRVVGVLDARPGGLGGPPVLTVSREALAAVAGTSTRPTDLLAVGDGAEAAASALASSRTRVLTRSGWLAEQQRLPLVGGVTAVTAAAAAVAEGFALVALVAEVVAGAARRRRIAALLATVGVRGRIARLLLLAEVGPVAVGALAAGLLAGGVTASAVGPVLRLDALTGGAAVVPAFSAPVVLVALLGVVPAVVVAVAVETLGARGLRPATTLRTGDAS